MHKLPFWKVQSIGNDFPLIHLEDLANIADQTEGQAPPTPPAPTTSHQPLTTLPSTPPPPPSLPTSHQPPATLPSTDHQPPTTDHFLLHRPPTTLPSLDFQLARLAAIICDRRFAVGGDGLLVVAKEDDAIRLRMFNPDGTEDFCGNGLRCAAQHVRTLGWVGDSFTIRHLGREVAVRIEKGRVITEIGRADYTPENIPLEGPELFNTTVWSGMDGGTPLSLSGSVLSTGTTHTIIPTYSLPDDDSFRSVSAKIEVDPKFPQRTSVMWSREVSENVIQLRIWERGVGETRGCGSGSAAAAVDYLRRKGRGGAVEVQNPGGSVIVRMSSWDSPIEMEGIAHEVYQGAFPFE